MKQIIGILAGILLATVARASEAPGHDTAARVIPKTTHAIVGQLVSCVATNEPGMHVLKVDIIPMRTLWGKKLTGSVQTRYEEFIPVFPEHINVSYANYTGSGIEFQARPKQPYICFLRKEKEAFTLLRLEPVENEKRILEFHKEQKEKTPTKPSTATE